MTAHGAWIWQGQGWPQLVYDLDTVAPRLAVARLVQGRLMGKAEALDALGQLPAEQKVWTEEALATASIEGEMLDPAAVRSSIARRLGMATPSVRVPRAVEGLLDVMQDAAQRWEQPLTRDRLSRWQAALFPTGQAGLRKIVTGAYRAHDTPMQIVSGPIGNETVHYEAPPAAAVNAEMHAFLTWFNEKDLSGRHDGLVRAAIAHLWFETIHPFEDGNGRVGRAIADLALAQDVRAPWRMHGLSSRMRKDREAYYEALNNAQRGSVNVTSWIVWFIATFARACEDSLVIVEEAVERGQYWAKYRHVSLSERQRKVLDTMLAAGRRGFEGGINLRKYMALTGMARASAQRELAQLVATGMLESHGAGRATRYELSMTGWQWHGSGGK